MKHLFGRACLTAAWATYRRVCPQPRPLAAFWHIYFTAVYVQPSYSATYWATQHPTELRYTAEIRCTLLSFAAPYLRYTSPYWATLHLNWVTLHPTELRCTLTELRCTQLSYAAPCWATLYPTEVCCTLLSYTVPCWATLQLSWATLHLPELYCTLLSYAESYWATQPKFCSKNRILKMCLRIQCYIYFWSGRLHFVRKKENSLYS
jgi:hypothetical protein